MRRNELVKIYQSTRAKTVKIEPSGFAMCDKTLRKNNADMRQLVVRISVPLRLQYTHAGGKLGRTEVRWRPGQDTSSAPPGSNCI